MFQRTSSSNKLNNGPANDSSPSRRRSFLGRFSSTDRGKVEHRLLLSPPAVQHSAVQMPLKNPESEQSKKTPMSRRFSMGAAVEKPLKSCLKKSEQPSSSREQKKQATPSTPATSASSSDSSARKTKAKRKKSTGKLTEDFLSRRPTTPKSSEEKTSPVNAKTCVVPEGASFVQFTPTMQKRPSISRIHSLEQKSQTRVVPEGASFVQFTPTMQKRPSISRIHSLEQKSQTHTSPSGEVTSSRMEPPSRTPSSTQQRPSVKQSPRRSSLSAITSTTPVEGHPRAPSRKPCSQRRLHATNPCCSPQGQQLRSPRRSSLPTGGMQIPETPCQSSAMDIESSHPLQSPSRNFLSTGEAPVLQTPRQRSTNDVGPREPPMRSPRRTSLPVSGMTQSPLAPATPCHNSITDVGPQKRPMRTPRRSSLPACGLLSESDLLAPMEQGPAKSVPLESPLTPSATKLLSEISEIEKVIRKMKSPLTPRKPKVSGTGQTPQTPMRTPITRQKKRVYPDPDFGVPDTPAYHMHQSPVLRYRRKSISRDTPVDNLDSSKTHLYEFARSCQWDFVSDECKKNPRDASYRCERDGTTALHLAIMSRTNPMMRDGKLGEEYQKAPLDVIEELIIACPEAAITRCVPKKYTPLSYACLVSDDGFDMSDAACMVRIILRHAPHSALVFTDEGFSALDVHIASYSRFHQEKEEVYCNGRTSTVLLQILLEAHPSLAQARAYGKKVRGPVELLYRANLHEFKDASNEDVVCCGGEAESSHVSHWWAWKWMLLLLRYASRAEGLGSEKQKKEWGSFSYLHAAARLAGCPTPVLALTIVAFPEHVRGRSPRNNAYNLPLHEVCGWVCDREMVCGDPFVLKRKAAAINLLLAAFPKGARMTNNMSETPLQLAIETNTPWDQGLEALVRACPGALAHPRKLRNPSDMNGNSLSVSLHGDIASVFSDDGNEDPAKAMDGMYPFMIAAALSHVSDSMRRPPAFTEKTLRQHEADLAKKDIQDLNSIYGLLRRKPDVLGRFIQEEKNRPPAAEDRTETSYEETYYSSDFTDDSSRVSRGEDTEEEITTYTEELVHSVATPKTF